MLGQREKLGGGDEAVARVRAQLVAVLLVVLEMDDSTGPSFSCFQLNAINKMGSRLRVMVSTASFNKDAGSRILVPTIRYLPILTLPVLLYYNDASFNILPNNKTK